MFGTVNMACGAQQLCLMGQDDAGSEEDGPGWQKASGQASDFSSAGSGQKHFTSFLGQ